MRQAASPVKHHAVPPRVVTINDATEPHHTLVGQWLHDVLNFATTWLPLFFVLKEEVTVCQQDVGHNI